MMALRATWRVALPCGRVGQHRQQAHGRGCNQRLTAAAQQRGGQQQQQLRLPQPCSPAQELRVWLESILPWRFSLSRS